MYRTSSCNLIIFTFVLACSPNDSNDTTDTPKESSTDNEHMSDNMNNTDKEEDTDEEKDTDKGNDTNDEDDTDNKNSTDSEEDTGKEEDTDKGNDTNDEDDTDNRNSTDSEEDTVKEEDTAKENGTNTDDKTDDGDDTSSVDDTNAGDSGSTTDVDQDKGCRGVDFLFVIDSSMSMNDEQEQLIRSFPGFIDAIVETLGLDDFHIMVVDSDADPNVPLSTVNCDAPDCCPELCELMFDSLGTPSKAIRCQEAATSPVKSCEEWAGEDPDPSTTDCDQTLGAGHVGTNNGTVCNISGNHRYLVQDQSNLYETFACIADVGTTGSGDELVMEAMVNAVDLQNQQGGCNEAFIRDDAILVVTFITDENDGSVPESGSLGNPDIWWQALVDAKGGDEEAIVMLGIFGDNDLPGGICGEYAEGSGDGAMPAPVLREFLELFPEERRNYCSVCLGDYSECFYGAVDTIDTTCDDFEITVI